MSENTQEVTATFNNLIDIKAVKFAFRKDELGNKRSTIELTSLPVPSVEGLIEILKAGGKQLDLLMTAASDVVFAQARSILNDNDSMVAETFPYDQCNWEAIANMPEAEKRGRGIAKEIWEAFAKDYMAIMPAITGKTPEQIALAAKLFLNKYAAVKTQKPIIGKLKEQLAIYANNSNNAENFEDCIKFFDEKAEALLLADEQALLECL